MNNSWYEFNDIVKNLDIKHQAYPLKKKTSFGVILYKKEQSSISYLICQKRFTDQYITFIRGKYNKYKLYEILSLMTKREQENIKMYDFDTLWRDTFLDFKGYGQARFKFNLVKMHIDKLCSICPPRVEHPKWEFPKGRRNKKENMIDCAKREFKEEIGEDLSLKTPSYPFTINEKIQGTDGNFYVYKYFLFEHTDEKFRANPSFRTLNEKSLNFEMKTHQWIQIPCVDFEQEFQKLHQIFSKKRTNIVLNIHIAIQQDPIAISMKNLFTPVEEDHANFNLKNEEVIGNIIII